MIPVFITVRDQVSPFQMFDQVLELTDGLPVLVDNASTHPPVVDALREYREQYPHVSFGPNQGNLVAWNRDLVLPIDEHMEKYGSPYFAVTDGDIDLTGVPVDALVEMSRVLDQFPEIPKVSLAITISDIPDFNPDRDRIIDHELKFWSHRAPVIDHEAYYAPSDTHFSMYRAASGWIGYDSIRLAGPFTARHIPWYWNPQELAEDVRWYLDHLDPTWSTWATRIRDATAH